MNAFLHSVVPALPGIWVPGLVVMSLTFTILAWAIPSWRGNALSSVFGFLASLGGIYCGRWLAAHRPPWLQGLLDPLELEAPQGNGVDLLPQAGSMFMSLLGCGLAYVVGMAAGRWLLRLWWRRAGSTEQDSPGRPGWSPPH